MLNTVCDDKENVVLHMAFSSSKMLSHFHFLLRTPDNSASLRHGDFTFSALFRAGINIRPEWSNRKWTGVKTPMIHWEAFEIQPLKSHSADVWARKWLQSFNSVYRTVPHWGTTYSAEVLRETRSYSLPVLTADVWNFESWLRLLWLMKKQTIILLHESQMCQETTYHTWLYFVPCSMKGTLLLALLLNIDIRCYPAVLNCPVSISFLR